MLNYYKKKFDEILEKKFSKNMQAGYDPLEVDMFFDNIRNFIIKSNDLLFDLQNQLALKDKEISELKNENLIRNNLVTLLNSEIDSYKKDGYQSQKIVKDLSSLKEQVMELKNKNDIK
ncbi:MAG: hypothetical protein RSA40_01075 [Malacoplasma sp.]